MKKLLQTVPSWFPMYLTLILPYLLISTRYIDVATSCLTLMLCVASIIVGFMLHFKSKIGHIAQGILNIASICVLPVIIKRNTEDILTYKAYDGFIVTVVLLIVALLIHIIALVSYTKNAQTYFKNYVVHHRLLHSQSKLILNGIIGALPLWMMLFMPPIGYFVNRIADGQWPLFSIDVLISFILLITGQLMLTRKKIGYICAFVYVVAGIINSVLLFLAGKDYEGINGETYPIITTITFVVMILGIIFELLIALYYILNRKKYILNTNEVASEIDENDEEFRIELEKVTNKFAFNRVMKSLFELMKKGKNLLIPVACIITPFIISHFIGIILGLFYINKELAPPITAIMVLITHIMTKKHTRQPLDITKMKMSSVAITIISGMLTVAMPSIIAILAFGAEIDTSAIDVETIIMLCAIIILFMATEILGRNGVQSYIAKINKWLGVAVGVLMSPFAFLSLLNTNPVVSIIGLIIAVAQSLIFHKTKNIGYGIILSTTLWITLLFVILISGIVL